MRSAVIFRVLYVAVLLLAVPSTSRAGGPPASTETVVMTDKARQLYDEGLAAIQKSKWLEARASLLAAWSLTKHWQIAANLAGCELELGKFRDAAEHAAFYLQNAPADRRAKAELVLKRAKQNIGTLTVDAQPAGAEVRLDGALVGQAPLPDALFVDPGEHVVLVRAPGRPDATQQVVLAAGEAKTIALAAVEAPPPPPPPPPPTRQGWRPGVALLATGGVLAAGGLIAGIGLTVAANGKSSSADSLRATVGSNSACAGTAASSATCATLLNDLQSRDSFTKGAFASFVLGGAFALATAGLGTWTATSPKDKQGAPAIRVVPAVGRAEGGLIVVGSF